MMKSVWMALALSCLSSPSFAVTIANTAGGTAFCKDNPGDEVCWAYRQKRADNNFCRDREFSGGDPRCVGNAWRRAFPDWNGDDPRRNNSGR